MLGSGKSPLAAYGSLASGALGSRDRIAVALNKATPYLLTATGVALCFRAQVINIGGEGQIAVGGLAATWVALALPDAPAGVLPIVAALVGALAGAAWAALAALVRLTRNVHEVLVTLLMNFIGVLFVSEMLHGELGEPGAGFPQSPLLARAAWLPRLVRETDLHVGASAPAAIYSGVSMKRSLLSVMLVAGGLAGLAGALEVLGVHYRLIEGFSSGFGFTAVSIALIGGLNPLGVLPAGLFFAFLETGALAMQRAVGVPSPLVLVIQGLTMVFVLAAVALPAPARRA